MLVEVAWAWVVELPSWVWVWAQGNWAGRDEDPHLDTQIPLPEVVALGPHGAGTQSTSRHLLASLRWGSEWVFWVARHTDGLGVVDRLPGLRPFGDQHPVLKPGRMLVQKHSASRSRTETNCAKPDERPRWDRHPHAKAAVRSSMCDTLSLAL